MKVATILGGLIVAMIVLSGEPSALAAGQAATHEAAERQEPALMLLSGALLLAGASLLRRYIP